MAKIISVNNSLVTIGTEDGGSKEKRTCDINFVPYVGDEVDIYESETKTIVLKKEMHQENPNEGVNLNVVNSNVADGGRIVYGNGTSAVNKVVYCLLTFFLGGIGIHKFYTGKIGTGILFIVFSWTLIPGLIAAIEFFIALFKRSDVNGNIIV